MTVDTKIRFALNRICAPAMPLADFCAMARRLQVTALELRNDLGGAEIADGTSADAVAAVVSAHGLTLRSINALQRFDQFDTQREHEALALARYAAASGAQALVLCPTNSLDDIRGAEQRHADLVQALRRLQPLLSDHGLAGLVEPLGFAECALRHKSQAVRALEELGSPACFALVHDSFHHHLVGDDQFFPALTGLVHVSGVEGPSLDVSELRDAHRVLVGPGDRLGNANQLRRLLDCGYAGYVSFEPFAREISTAPDIERRLSSSMAYLSAALAASTGAHSSSVR